MIQECKNYELEEPELMDYDGDFRVNLYRKELLAVIIKNIRYINFINEAIHVMIDTKAAHGVNYLRRETTLSKHYP